MYRKPVTTERERGERRRGREKEEKGVKTGIERELSWRCIAELNGFIVRGLTACQKAEKY